MPLVQPRQNAIVNTSILLYKDNMMSGPTVLTQSRAGSRAGAGRQLRAVPAVTRAVAILRLLGRSEESLGVHAIARALGLVPSTCLHILRVFVAEALVAFAIALLVAESGCGKSTVLFELAQSLDAANYNVVSVSLTTVPSASFIAQLLAVMGLPSNRGTKAETAIALVRHFR